MARRAEDAWPGIDILHIGGATVKNMADSYQSNDFHWEKVTEFFLARSGIPPDVRESFMHLRRNAIDQKTYTGFPDPLLRVLESFVDPRTYPVPMTMVHDNDIKKCQLRCVRTGDLVQLQGQILFERSGRGENYTHIATIDAEHAPKPPISSTIVENCKLGVWGDARTSVMNDGRIFVKYKANTHINITWTASPDLQIDYEGK